MAFLPSATISSYDENSGIQYIFNILRKNYFQLTNKFFAQIILPEQIRSQVTSEDLKILTAYVKSVNMTGHNVVNESVNQNGMFVNHPVSLEDNENIQTAFWSDMNKTPRYIIELWKDMVFNSRNGTAGYKDEFVGQMLVYSLKGLESIIDSNSDPRSILDKVGNVAKDLGKYVVRQTGVVQLADQKSLEIPKDKIKYQISQVRIYNNVYPFSFNATVYDKSDMANTVLETVSMKWDTYKDLYIAGNADAYWNFKGTNISQFL